MAYTDEVQTALNSRDFELAAAVLKENAAEHGNETDFFISWSLIALALGDGNSALEFIKEGLLIHPLDGELLYSAASIYYNCGDYRLAYRAYKKARNYIDDASLLEQLDSIIAELKDRDGFYEPTVESLTQNGLKRMSFSRNLDTPGDFCFLMRRIEFGWAVETNLKTIKNAVKSDKVSKSQITEFIHKNELHEQRLIDLFDGII